MKYAFRYLGLVKNQAVFQIVADDERGLNQAGVDVNFYHYKVDEHLNVEKVGYFDKDVSVCCTTVHRADGTVEPPRSVLITESQTKAFYDTLIERNVFLDGLGYLVDLNVDFINNYAFEFTNKSEKRFYKYYDGVDVERATKSKSK